jgi:hypothetical protein
MEKDEIIGLDDCVKNALKLFTKKIPNIDLGNYSRPLVVGSGNAAVTGRIIFQNKDAVFADESTYEEKIKSAKVDGAILISSSGGKHAPVIAKNLREKNIEVRFLTNNPNAPAKDFIDKDKFFVFPKNPEPYTYNTSTYMSMIIAHTKENPAQILDFIEKKIEPLIPKNLSEYDAFYFIIPEKFNNFREMILTKFDELFGPRISARAFTPEQSKHAKSIVNSPKELFVSLGYDNNMFGEKRLNLPLPKNTDYASIMAIGYYFVGKIQAQNPNWFKEGIEEYCKKASKLFGTDIKPMVN